MVHGTLVATCLLLAPVCLCEDFLVQAPAEFWQGDERQQFHILVEWGWLTRNKLPGAGCVPGVQT